ncbi:MAG TPA: hypothetical protein VJ739_19890, partial [Gemmataceae bacterium]|nr:hypothetical protein [Gemmataceae bacterium]
MASKGEFARSQADEKGRSTTMLSNPEQLLFGVAFDMRPPHLPRLRTQDQWRYRAMVAGQTVRVMNVLSH